jgi:Na+-translocating ferredoxin:NAD+ oxidoreductase RnfC subunit
MANHAVEPGAEIVQRVRAAGVVGAGGAGFPAHVKLAAAHVDAVIANGAECEPLVHVDQELMITRADDVVRGLRFAMQATHAGRGFLGVKQRYTQAITALRQAAAGFPDISIAELGNFYPAGDEQVLVYDVLGRVVPEGGIPLNVGAVVQNVESLINIDQAQAGLPVVTKHITVAGDVARPVTVRVPVGITLREVIDLAGGARTPDALVLNGGAMMGTVVQSLDAPVTKTTKLLLVLPRNHYLSNLRMQSQATFERRAKSACDQCFICTDFCPRHNLGHAIEPHKLIRMLGSGLPVTDPQLAGAFLCCECRTCNYACPVHLLPGNVAIATKRALLQAGLKNPYHQETSADPFRDVRRVPILRLISRLDLARYDVAAPLTQAPQTYRRVRLLLKQHTGAPARPIVAVGDRVQVGEVVGEVPEGAIGARVHASIAGIVREVSDAVVIEADQGAAG